MHKSTFGSPQETLDRQRDKADAYLAKVLKGVDHLKLPHLRRRRLHALLGVNGCLRHIRLSDVPARKKAAEILLEVVQELQHDLFRRGMKLYHATFIDDIGVTSDRQPHLRIQSFKRKVDKALRSMGQSGLIFVEVQPLLNYPAGGQGRTLLVNAHALCWGNVSRRTFQVAKKKLNHSRAWRSQFDADPVHTRELHDVEAALRLLSYITKLPHDGKYRVPRANGACTFRSTLTGYPDRLALRIAEGLSHYSIFNAVFSVGEAKVIRSEWKRRLIAWQRQRATRIRMVSSFDIPKFWTRVRRSAGAYYPSGFEAD